MEYKKVYSGSEINALAVKDILEQYSIDYVIQDDVASGVIAGFGTLDRAVHVFVLEDKEQKALQLISNLQV